VPILDKQPDNILQVALPVPLRKVFDYLAQPQDAPALPGCRVLVPFGNRKLVGVVIAVGCQTSLARAKLKSILEVLDKAPLIAPAQLKFLQWAANYYHHPLGEAIDTALPALLRQGKPAEVAGVSE